ncbi:MAG: A/G-specific adenine glycosylase [Eubacteriales bacterium]|nr:A/G-specific adenine glycosylase [Eubacteriales bacterium]
MSRQESASADKLLAWYEENRRILPWREDPTPYHVWISEIMLQQTRVEAVREYYRRFLEACPEISDLAEAKEDRYMKLWEGLGYYSRVRNLHRAAVQVMEECGGELPATREALMRLPGIGRYTASAIASIAFGQMTPAVDGNLLRIYARMTYETENIRTPAASRAAEQYFTRLMQEITITTEDRISENQTNQENAPRPFSAYGNFNQALMDLGATVCLPNGAPRCGSCPWRETCRAHELGRETEVPVIPAKKPRTVEKLTVFLIQDAGRTALHKRAAKGLLARLYEFPNAEGHLSEDEALTYVRRLGYEPLRIRSLGPARHIFTHKEWDMIGYAVRVDELQGRRMTGAAVSPTEDAETGERESLIPLILADTREVEQTYSIPSAFAAYTRQITG